VSVNLFDVELQHDEDDPPGYGTDYVRTGPLVGGAQLGLSVYGIGPGQSICPYHYECGEEEWLVVLSGTPTLRSPDGEERLQPWDVACFPRGPEGAHSVRNETEEYARVLMFSTVVVPTASVYPDSDKVGIWTGDPETDVLVRRSSNVDYYDGEA
jgi:uncharacterized cupin superfamily protein